MNTIRKRFANWHFGRRLKSTVAAVGTGQMGSQLCIQMSNAGCRVMLAGERSTKYQRKNLATKAAPESNGQMVYADSILEAFEKASVVVTCLPNSDVVNLVYNDLLSSGLRDFSHLKLWIDATSGNPKMSRELAKKLKADGVEYVDAAVSGGPAGARDGILTSMIGGTNEGAAAAHVYLKMFSSNIVHVGPPGSGHAVKCVNNAIMATNLWVAGEGISALTKFGISPSSALAAINTSSGRSWATQNRLPNHVVTRGFDYGFSLNLLEKDHRTCMESVIQTTSAYAPMLDAMHGHLKNAQTILDNEYADHTEIVKIIEQESNIEITDD